MGVTYRISREQVTSNWSILHNSSGRLQTRTTATPLAGSNTCANLRCRYSYTLVENSIENGRLEDLSDYQVGRRSPRPMGATNIPRSSKRNEYTLEDDQILWDYMYPFEQLNGAPIQGQKIYQEIAEKVSSSLSLSLPLSLLLR